MYCGIAVDTEKVSVIPAILISYCDVKNACQISNTVEGQADIKLQKQQ